MAEQTSNNAVKETAPFSLSTNVTANGHSLARPSLDSASATALPASPQVNSPSRTFQRTNSSVSSNGKPPRSPILHRSPSSMSLDARSSTPTLLRKASMNSLHGIGGVTPSRPSSSRRLSSAQFVNASAMVGRPSPSEIETIEAPPQHTAESIASAHFKKELEFHDKEEGSPDSIVILHDACYGHRYSRPRTSKASLSTIVERPERIHASILGLSVAYVRLGERHAEGQYPLHPDKDPSAIPAAPFRIHKTTRRLLLSSQAVTNVHGTKWMEELKIMCDNAEAKLALNGKELTRPDMPRSPEQEQPAKLHEGDLYLCAESLNAMEGALGAVCEGVDAVFQGSTTGKGPHRAFVAIRPPGHHCSASYPSGFCWVNNVHVGISHAALTHGLTHAAIIDFDLHHGDGSQTIAWEHNSRANSLPKNALPWKKTSIGYFSLHDINSYPCEMGDEGKVKNASLCIENAHGQSIWNVHLQPWKSEPEFWKLYEDKYSILLEKTRNYLRTQTERFSAVPNGPKARAAIFLSAGFDASEWESSGMQRHKVNVPTEFYARLTRDVVKIATEEGTGVEGRVVSVLEGGYSDRALCTGVFSHLSGLAGSQEVVIKKELNYAGGLGYEMGQKIGALNGGVKSDDDEPAKHSISYDPSWWSVQRLEQLDATIKGTPPPETRKPRDGTPPTYSTPTQSFIAKVGSPRAQRAVSGSSTLSNGSPRPISRAPLPPPPDVDWTVAAHELSKLLIPTDRQTMSCRPEDLAAEATRARRDRQSLLVLSTAPSCMETAENPGNRMALRVRKPAKPTFDAVEEQETKQAVSKSNRRKTVAGAGVLASGKAPARSSTPSVEPSYSKPTSQSSRRLSIASTTGSVVSDAPSTRPTVPNRVVSNGTSNRPGSSQSIRPDSSMSSRGHSIPPVVVKKTRALAQPRPEGPKPSRVRRKSPLNTDAAPPIGNDETFDVPSRTTSLTIPTTETMSSDMDELTSGMKKIKLNLTTKAQREAKEQAKAVNGVALKLSRKPAASRQDKKPVNEPVSTQALPMQEPPASASTNGDLHIPKQYPTSSHVTPQSPQPQPQPSFQPAAQPTTEPLPLPNPAVSSFSPTTALSASTLPSTPDIFIPYQPEGPPPDTMTQQKPLQWLPPNTATPSPLKRAELPVFTATGAIPFGVKGMMQQIGGQQRMGNGEGGVVGEGQQRKVERDVWEVPETPRK